MEATKKERNSFEIHPRRIPLTDSSLPKWSRTLALPGSCRKWHLGFSTHPVKRPILSRIAEVAAAIRTFLTAKKFSFSPPPNPRINTLAVQHRQHKKPDQLISEFAVIHWLPSHRKINDSQKVIPSSLRGIPRRRSDEEVKWWHLGGNLTHTRSVCKQSPGRDSPDGRMRFVSESEPKLVSIERRKNLLKARIMAKQLDAQAAERLAGISWKSGEWEENPTLAEAAGATWLWWHGGGEVHEGGAWSSTLLSFETESGINFRGRTPKFCGSLQTSLGATGCRLRGGLDIGAGEDKRACWQNAWPVQSIQTTPHLAQPQRPGCCLLPWQQRGCPVLHP